MTKLCRKSVLFLGQARAGRCPVQARIAAASVVLSANGTGSAPVFIKEEHEAPSEPHSLKILLTGQKELNYATF